MNFVRRRAQAALALSLVGVAACSDRPVVTDPEVGRGNATPTQIVPLAVVSAADPTATPVGPPTRIDFFGRAKASNKSLSFPWTPPPADQERVLASVRDWLAQAKKERANGSHDRGLQRQIDRAERLLAAKTLEDLRGALGPDRARIRSRSSVKELAPGVVRHTAYFSLDGRDLVRAVTHARVVAEADWQAGRRADCADDPNDTAIDPGLTCGNYTPEQLGADAAALLSEADAMALDVELSAASAPDRCQTEFWAVMTALGTMALGGGEAFFFSRIGDIPKAYVGLKLGIGGAVLAYTAFRAYKDCLAGHTANS
jgi:hypothetical protein